MNLQSLLEKGEVAFDAKFGTIKHRGFPQNAIKAFMRHHTLSILEALKEEIELMQTMPAIETRKGKWIDYGYKSALSTLLTKLEE